MGAEVTFPFAFILRWRFNKAVSHATMWAQGARMGEVTLRVRVTPRGGRDALAGWQDGVLRVRLVAPPVEGRANEALVRFLAKTLGLPLRDVRLVGGETSREKRLVIEGVGAEELRARLGIPPDQRLR